MGGGFVLVALGVWARSHSGSPRTRSVAAPLALVAVVAFAVSGCGGSAGAEDKAEQASEPVKVVATSTQVGDLVRQVGGDVVQVTTLLPAGTDPHAYEPKPSAVTAIAAAKVVFRSGGDIDNWLAPAVKAAGNSRPPVDLSNSAVLLKSPGEVFNAHWYLSPDNLSAAAQRVRDELIKTAPSARETLRANTTTYINRIDATSDALAGCAAKLAAKDRVVLTGHNDFDYLTRRFGLKAAGQLTETGQSEPSASDVQRAVDRARSSGARALVTSRGEVAQLAVEVAKRLKIPLLGLYSDSLAASGPASTALGAIAYDLGKIVNATSGGTVGCPPAKTV
jgi:ABC-type Zn uptake system ZnuABC Zn-binding protein ZnuA